MRAKWRESSQFPPSLTSHDGGTTPAPAMLMPLTKQLRKTSLRTEVIWARTRCSRALYWANWFITASGMPGVLPTGQGIESGTRSPKDRHRQGEPQSLHDCLREAVHAPRPHQGWKHHRVSLKARTPADRTG